MKNLILSLAFIAFGAGTLLGQHTRSLFVEGGGILSDFQDVKYSKVISSGIGASFRFGYAMDSPVRIMEFGLQGTYSKEKTSTHDLGNISVVHPKVYVSYLRKINEKIAVGATWDVLGLYIRNDAYLGNNGIYYIGSSDLFASGTYDLGKFRFGLDLGLLSYFKESTSFGFSAPQNVLENGAFDYQNEALESPFGFKYYKLAVIPKNFHLRTSIGYQLTERLTVRYSWQVRHFSEVKDYPTTTGKHNVSVRFNITHKDKTPKS